MVCHLCSKQIANDDILYEIKGGLGNKILYYLCEDCYNIFI